MDDPRIKQLRDLIREVTKLQHTTRRLIVDLTERLQRTRTTGHDAPIKEPRQKPRNG